MSGALPYYNVVLMKKQCAILVLLLPVAACIPDHWPEKWRQLANETEAVKPAEPMPQWCYRTLGKVDCYQSPHPAWSSRLVSEPPPRQLKQPEAREKIREENHPPPVSLHAK